LEPVPRTSRDVELDIVKGNQRLVNGLCTLKTTQKSLIIGASAEDSKLQFYCILTYEREESNKTHHVSSTAPVCELYSLHFSASFLLFLSYLLKQLSNMLLSL
jgi:hypothetical protein